MGHTACFVINQDQHHVYGILPIKYVSQNFGHHWHKINWSQHWKISKRGKLLFKKYEMFHKYFEKRKIPTFRETAIILIHKKNKSISIMIVLSYLQITHKNNHNQNSRHVRLQPVKGARWFLKCILKHGAHPESKPHKIKNNCKRPLCLKFTDWESSWLGGNCHGTKCISSTGSWQNLL